MVEVIGVLVVDWHTLEWGVICPLLVGLRSALVCGPALSATDVSPHVGIGNVRQFCVVLRIISGR